ncbi:Fur family transcriptional regulator [Baaleninema sp.]|uniref:Fur family transcriptional regulator n=1 Tax=Baaleninema sp. TaxID=3101197 RepID=UPI003D01A575
MYSYNSEAFKAELNQLGLRLTPQRETILRVFQELPKGEHLSAEDLYQCLQEKETKKKISLSTIYRSLKLMTHLGLLRELELAEGHKHYELNQPQPYHHHHLVCVKCNKTIEFKSDSVLKIGIKTTNKEGFHLLDCQLTIHGVCLEAMKRGWPSGIPEDWTCPRALS